MTKAEPGVRIGYIILAHKGPQQVARLVSRLDGDEASFFVHIDKRTKDAVYREFLDSLDHLPNVRFVRRHASRWGDFGLVRATLEGLGAALDTRPPVDYLVLLTGQDYPIKSPEHIAAFLEGSAGRSYLDCNPIPCEAWPQAEARMRSWYARILGEQVLLPRKEGFRGIVRRPRRWPVFVISRCLPERRRPLEGHTPFTGSAHWVLSRAAAEYVRDLVARDPGFVRYFKRVFVPDELFFQTALGDSPVAEHIVSKTLHYIDWSRGGAHPATLTRDDLEALAASPALFARKFDPAVDAEILDLIDERLLTSAPPVQPAQPASPAPAAPPSNPLEPGAC